MIFLTIIGFVRHGITAWNKEGRAQGSSDIPLDDEGMEMAKRVSNRLANEQWDAIYTSPQKRARQTAEIIADNMAGIELVVDDRLREVGGGMIEGTTEKERIEKWGEDWRRLDMGFELQESIISRGLAVLEEIKEKYPEQRILVVSHGSFIKRMLNELINDSTFDVSLDNTSLTIVDLQQDKSFCQLFNCTKHL